MRIASLTIIDFRIINAPIRLLGCSDRSVPLSLYLYCLRATKPDYMFFDGTGAICDDKLQCALAAVRSKAVVMLLLIRC